MSTATFLPSVFPEAWASAWGEDQYGLWMAFSVDGIEQRMRWIPRGTFQMGEETGQHWVTFSAGFWLAETVCTQQLYSAIMNASPSRFNGEQLPVASVSHDDAVVFAGRLNTLVPGLQSRLPTESEWEYACRAGTTSAYWFGDEITELQANYYSDKTIGVKARPCNSWGLYQMHGNVYEWCADWLGDYPKEHVTDPIGPKTGDGRVLRGGGWNDPAGDLRSAARLGYSPDLRYYDIGFRLARGQPVELGPASAAFR